PLGKSLDQVAEKATDVSTKLDALDARAVALDHRTQELESVDQRIHVLKEASNQADQAARKATLLDRDLRQHRNLLERLSVQAQQTQSSLDTLKKEHAAFENLRRQLLATQVEV